MEMQIDNFKKKTQSSWIQNILFMSMIEIVYKCILFLNILKLYYYF
jgi:hypothetical protein